MSERVGILALQGSFAPHRRALERLGAEVRLVRRAEDLDGVARLVIPGGESTTMARLGAPGVLPAVRDRGRAGMPIFGTCAGAILLGEGPPPPDRLGLVPVRVERNAYGRQKESFTREIQTALPGGPFRCIFIRAPKMRLEGNGVEVLALDGEDPILIRRDRILLATFHPELTDDLRVHRLFLEM
ncbi:MAG: pyridoxal 5'-phosphate synthase glutaminase subunit PdxT [Planctomycetes bacterium]|nr:pyridoxal 5'-phosphate synthase glutaminase subunit PdxT [Planctomycetota bacterium]